MLKWAKMGLLRSTKHSGVDLASASTDKLQLQALCHLWTKSLLPSWSLANKLPSSLLFHKTKLYRQQLSGQLWQLAIILGYHSDPSANTYQVKHVLTLTVMKKLESIEKVVSSDGSRSKIFDPGRVSHLWFGFEFWKFPLKMSNFQFFSLRVKKNCFGSGRKVPGSKPGRPLIYCRSKVSSGRVRAHL